jgi:hypothetical protein
MEMPDLPPSEKRSEERKQLKFWIEHCHNLEAMVSALKEEISALKEELSNNESVTKRIRP